MTGNYGSFNPKKHFKKRHRELLTESYSVVLRRQNTTYADLCWTWTLDAATGMQTALRLHCTCSPHSSRRSFRLRRRPWQRILTCCSILGRPANIPSLTSSPHPTSSLEKRSNATASQSPAVHIHP